MFPPPRVEQSANAWCHVRLRAVGARRQVPERFPPRGTQLGALTEGRAGPHSAAFLFDLTEGRAPNPRSLSVRPDIARGQPLIRSSRSGASRSAASCRSQGEMRPFIQSRVARDIELKFLPATLSSVPSRSVSKRMPSLKNTVWAAFAFGGCALLYLCPILAQRRGRDAGPTRSPACWASAKAWRTTTCASRQESSAHATACKRSRSRSVLALCIWRAAASGPFCYSRAQYSPSSRMDR